MNRALGPLAGAVTTLVFSSVLALACSAPPDAGRGGSGGDSASAPPADPRIFGEGVISTEAPEFATSFSPDGETVYFNRASADRSVLRIFESHRVDGSWSAPRPLPFSDGTWRDLDPFVAADGRRLLFTSDRPVEGAEAKDFDLWLADRGEDGTWGEPVPLGAPVNTSNNEIFCTRSLAGNLYFSVFREDGTGTVVRARWRNGAYGEPEPLTFEGAEILRLGNPLIAPDESFLVLSALDPEGGGDTDLFVSRPQPDGTWSRPESLGERINSPFADFAPALGPDGRSLFFTSERPGVVPEGEVEGRPPGDLYEVTWEDQGAP